MDDRAYATFGAEDEVEDSEPSSSTPPETPADSSTSDQPTDESRRAVPESVDEGSAVGGRDDPPRATYHPPRQEGRVSALAAPPPVTPDPGQPTPNDYWPGTSPTRAWYGPPVLGDVALPARLSPPSTDTNTAHHRTKDTSRHPDRCKTTGLGLGYSKRPPPRASGRCWSVLVARVSLPWHWWWGLRSPVGEVRRSLHPSPRISCHWEATPRARRAQASSRRDFVPLPPYRAAASRPPPARRLPAPCNRLQRRQSILSSVTRHRSSLSSSRLRNQRRRI